LIDTPSSDLFVDVYFFYKYLLLLKFVKILHLVKNYNFQRFQTVPPPLPPRRNYTVKGNQKLVYQPPPVLHAASSAAINAAAAASNTATTAFNTAPIAAFPSIPATNYSSAAVAVVNSLTNTTNCSSATISNHTVSIPNLASLVPVNGSWRKGVGLQGIQTSYLI